MFHGKRDPHIMGKINFVMVGMSHHGIPHIIVSVPHVMVGESFT